MFLSLDYLNVVNLFIVYESCAWYLFGALRLYKSPDPDKNGHGIGFDVRSQFSLPNGKWGKKVIIFGVDDSSYVHTDNKKKCILVFGEGATQRLDDTVITAEAKYRIYFTGS